MCCNNCKSKCLFAFGLGLIVGAFFESGFTLVLIGIAVIILSLALKQKCC